MAKEVSSRAKSGMGGSKSKSKSKSKHPHHLTIHHGKSGGHIVTHHFEPDENGITPPDEDHVVPDKESLLSHIDQNVPDTPAPAAAPAGPIGPAGSAPMPAPGPAPAPQGM